MDYRRTLLRDLMTGTPGTQTTAYGWVKTRRDSKGVSFVQLNDGSCFADLQVVIPAGAISDDLLKQATTGACVAFSGELVESPGAGQSVELRADALELFGSADPAHYPLQKKGASFEFLREIAHLRVRGNTFGAVSRVRNRASYAVHNFFQSRGFQWIHTPIITASDCEGAGAMFAVTTLLQEQHTPEGRNYSLKSQDAADDFFGKPAYLTVSGQLNVETYAMGLTNVYTFGPTFRAENSNSARHLAEFWMIEPEMAFYELPDNMDLAEAFIKRIIRDALEKCSEDMQLFDQHVEKGLIASLQSVVDSQFVRLPYTDAIELLQKSEQKFDYPVQWGTDLQSEHERWLVEQHFKSPVILYNYPRTIKPFYMYCNDDGKTVRAMDVLVPRAGEIIGGSQREERYDVLEQRIKEAGLDPEPYWWYMDLRKYGSAPHSGFGLGFERLIMYLTGMQNIRDVIPFHRTPGQAAF